MEKLWVRRDIDAPQAVVWELLTDTKYWPEWGPSVRRAEVDDGRLRQGAQGKVTTVAGLDVPFEIIEFDEGVRWSWKVAGVRATDHTVESLGPGRCRTAFGVPWPAAPYLAVCRLALERIESMAEAKASSS